MTTTTTRREQSTEPVVPPEQPAGSGQVAAAEQARWAAITVAQREEFEQQGFLILRGALDADEVRHYRGAVEAVRDGERSRGTLGPDGSVHLLGAVGRCPDLAGLLDHPATFGLVWSVLGWNLHVYHSHIDVHPEVVGPRDPWWHWHQDGGRQNRELETDPRPRMSVKLAYWLSDVSRTGRGNLTVVPGSHRTNWLAGPPRRGVPWPTPPGAVQVTVEAGDVVFFDRRLWHARSLNRSDVVRAAVFLGYTYRWVRIRDDVAALPREPWWAGLTGVQRQLLGSVRPDDGDHAWGHEPATTPLYVALAEQGLLDVRHPPLIP
jgi:ectoine hydroxylase-related dioxygenase (phytanoyl-CoA dioxygenase family)